MRLGSPTGRRTGGTERRGTGVFTRTKIAGGIGLETRSWDNESGKRKKLTQGGFGIGGEDE